jgi:hypothetical protein
MLVKIGKINDNRWHFDPSASKHISRDNFGEATSIGCIKFVKG